MKQVLKILIVEDTPNDVELILRTLEKAGLQADSKTVDSLEELTTSLESSDWDLILSDYNLPGFNGLQALEISCAKRPGIPFILISGAVGEEKAVDLMHAGARDFVSKNNLKRLIPTIQRELAVRSRTDTLEKELLSTLATMSEGLLTVDRNWFVTYANNEAINYLKKSPEEILGKTLTELYPLPDLEKFLVRYRNILKTGTPEKFIESYQDRILHIHAIRTVHGGISIFFRNITAEVEAERKQQELLQSLEIAKIEAEKANQLKSAFLANMSHEIRTPLGAILGFADLLKDPNIASDELQSFVDIIVRSGNQLSHLINEILDLSKVESGHMTVDKIAVNPMEAVKEVMDLFQVKAKEKSIQLSFSVEGETPNQILSDPVRLKQILTNMIGNAIKFTQVGSVQVRLHPTTDQKIAIEVKDTGIGIDPTNAGHLFQVFQQADSSITRKFGGTGLGLALSRRLAQVMGGDIILAHSELGKGSTFLITIATNVSQKEVTLFSRPVLQMTETPLQFRPGLKILVVEDSPDNQFLISRILSKRGVDLMMVDNGLEGIQKALKGQFDLVLMDIQMPGMDGYTATQRLREQGYTKPIIALTAHAMSEVRVKCLDVGFTDHLTKPIDSKLLVATIGRYS